VLVIFGISMAIASQKVDAMCKAKKPDCAKIIKLSMNVPLE
jgi:hypothetical protein